MANLYPSLLAADKNSLDKIVRELEPLCPGYHIDIMDNKFVPNTGVSIEKTNEIAKLTYRKLWVHLMVEEPESYLNKLQLPVDSIVTFHIESHKATRQTINRILEKKWLPGIAIKPKTGVDEIFPFLGSIHQALIMSVEPGFSGQPFLEGTLAKVGPLLGYRDTGKLNFKIAMDGGISEENLALVIQKGVDDVALGSALFDAKVGPVKAYEFLSKIAE